MGDVGVWGRGGGERYGPAELGAMRRILGRSSVVAGSVDLVVRCSLSAWRRCLGVELMMGDVERVIERLGAWRR
jgi:hypothetical protein